MKGFKLPAAVEKIGAHAFEGCNRINDENKFVFAETESKLTEIGDYAFAGARFTELTVPEGVTKIGEGAFASVTTALR